jgi:hypothetical protein
MGMPLRNNSTRRPQGGALNIIEERLMAEVPRGEKVLRLSFVKALTEDGKERAWHSLKLFWKTSDGRWLPDKQPGFTLRGRELEPIRDALNVALSGGSEPANDGAAAEPAEDIAF